MCAAWVETVRGLMKSIWAIFGIGMTGGDQLQDLPLAQTESEERPIVRTTVLSAE